MGICGEEMIEYLSKEKEKRLLIGRIFPTPYAGSDESTLTLFKVCKDLGSSLCSQFDERGYTKEYVPFNKESVLDEVSKLIADNKLSEVALKNKDILSGYFSFRGKYYTYEPDSKSLTLGSSWDKIRKQVIGLINSMTECVKCVLEAVVEVSKANIYDSYWPIFTLSKEKGLGKGWWKVLSKLQLGKVIGEDYRHMNIQFEVIPLIEEILEEIKNGSNT